MPAPSEVQVVFALHDRDGRYWVNTAVAIASVAQHASMPVRFHILHDGTLTRQAADRMRAMARRLRLAIELRRVQLPAGFEPVKWRKFSVAANFRLMIPELFREQDLVVYLDSDLVANGLDIADLVGAAATDHPISAVWDPYMGAAANLKANLDVLGVPPSEYFNSGVLVMRPSLLQEDLLAGFLAFTRERGVTMHPDQDFINTCLRGRIHRLDRRFNEQACPFDNTLTRPIAWYRGKIVHYAGPAKPTGGYISTAFVPFWMHASLVPEAADVFDAAPAKYVFPDKSNPDTVQLRRVAPLGAKTGA